jgi:hypothetical protein
MSPEFVRAGGWPRRSFDRQLAEVGLGDFEDLVAAA